MNEHDDPIETRLVQAAEQLTASFSQLDTDSELRIVTAGNGLRHVPADPPSRRWLAIAAAAVLIAVGTVALAMTAASRRDDTPSASSLATAPGPTTITPTTTPVTEPVTTTPTTSTELVPTTPPSSIATTTQSPSTTVPIEPFNDTYVIVDDEDPTVIQVRDTDGVVASIPLTCPSGRDCVVQSATVMGDTVWVAFTESEPEQAGVTVRSRVIRVTPSTSTAVEELAVDGTSPVRSAARGADGVVYAYFNGSQSNDRQLVAVDHGQTRTVATGVAGFRLSDDGRYLAVSYSNPQKGELARFEVADLVNGTTNSFQTNAVNAGPAAWSPDGRYLLVDEQWERSTAWVVDPWSASGEPLPGTENFVSGGCFVNSAVIAHRTWKVGYGQGDAQLGVIRLTSLETGSTVADIGDELFGDSFRCLPDGSFSYIRRPVIEVELSPGVTQLEPDYEAQLELVHIAADGTTIVDDSGLLSMV